MVEHPEASERVLDEIADDPVRGEELSGGGDLVGPGLLVLLEPGEDFVFALRDVELVEPADDLDVFADVFGEDLDGTVEDGVVGEQVGRDEEFGVVAFALEHEGHGAVPVAAVSARSRAYASPWGRRCGGCRRAGRDRRRACSLTTIGSITPRLASARISGWPT
jgi:hypothetical protein